MGETGNMLTIGSLMPGILTQQVKYFVGMSRTTFFIRRPQRILQK
jgi:hypothetical protein